MCTGSIKVDSHGRGEQAGYSGAVDAADPAGSPGRVAEVFIEAGGGIMGGGTLRDGLAGGDRRGYVVACFSAG